MELWRQKRPPRLVLCMALILDGNLEIWCARQEQSLLRDLFKAFDSIDSSLKSNIFSAKTPIFLHACAACSELPCLI